MRNPAKIIIGIIIFIALLSIPIWVTQASGNAEYTIDSDPEFQLPDPAVVEQVSGSADYVCMEPTDYMRLNHKKLLYEYRADAVRTDSEDDPGDVTVYGQPFSVNGTCFACHTDRTVFCDKCHDYTATQMGCWECHDWGVE
ncbi:hypothetical protein ACFLTQ_02270 [Chloroflexota bacterium]